MKKAITNLIGMQDIIANINNDTTNGHQEALALICEIIDETIEILIKEQKTVI